jgi:hypothetical protein
MATEAVVLDAVLRDHIREVLPLPSVSSSQHLYGIPP